MDIIILNGDMLKEESGFSKTMAEFSNQLSQNHSVRLFNLNEEDLKYCTGCWTCWWKTPGICSISDGIAKIHESVINSDLVIFASPLMAGFISSSLKSVTERFVPLLHPYITVIDGECHHKKRYDKYPDFAVLIEKEADTDEEDLEILNEYYDRLALNFHGEKKYLKCISESSVEEIVNETSNL